MKKLISLLLALVMVVSLSTVAFAAEFAFELVLMDEAQENEVTEINVGDKVYLMLSANTKAVKYGVEINIDMTAFEIGTYEEDGETYEEADFGAFTGSYVINPEGQENVMSVGGMKTGAKGNISATFGLIATKPGTYEISFKGQQDKNMPTDSTSVCVTDPITLVVKGGEPAAPTAASIGLKTDDSQILRLSDVDVNNVDGTSYKVDTALGFVSCVNKDANATDLYTEINLEGWTGEALKIPAKNTTEIGDQIYFVAAVTSIREANLNKAFSAKAFATVDGTPVTDSNTVSATYNVQ